jgi:H+-translocating NAD(P) transhydrogenase subunit alpha
MIIGFCKSEMDIKCPISPAIAKKYVKDGWEIWIEQGLGEIINANYEGGVTEKSRDEILAGADVVYANRFSNLSELASVNKASMVVSNFRPYENATVSEELKKYGFKASSMDMIPRTTLAQSMDVLSSMASIAGYKAVIKGADLLQKYLPMMMTAAGTIKPSKILILGAGVAGLQAIATAKRMGAKVEVFDVRKAVKEEVQSLGGTFVEVEGSTDDKGAGGYAVEQTDEYKQKQKELIAKHVKGADIVIATAQLRGKRAPILVTQEMVDAMEKGSVIIDLASSSGGNCEVTQDGKVIDYKGIKVMGNSFLENDMILDSSSLLSSNIYNYLKIFVKEGQLNFDMENEIINGSIINK